MKPPSDVLSRIAFILTLLAAIPACGDDWRRVTEGVDYQHVTRGELDAHVTRIDLRNPKIRVVATNASERALTVSEYAKKTHAIVAINGDYFDELMRPIGLAMGSCGVWWRGTKVGRKQGLVAIGRHRAEIQQNTMKTRAWMSGAVSGWPLINRDCDPIATLPGSDHFTRAPHPRTAVGLSSDGRTMYFVVAEGRTEKAVGLTLPELARFMDELGACVAMNLDGGGSSAMWVEDRIVNQPSDGFERKVGDHLAVISASEHRGCDGSEWQTKD